MRDGAGRLMIGYQVEVAAPAASRAAVVAAYVYGLLVVAGLAHFLLGIPIQLTDSFGNMAQLDRPWRELLLSGFYQRAYLRPFLQAELKLVYDAAGGNYFAWYRGVHVAQVLMLVVLYLHLVRPRTWRDAALIPLGLAVLIGLHTFTNTVTEAFPVNTFMTVLLCCLAAANVAFARHRWWSDPVALSLFIVAALTVESGLLVSVIFIGAALVGARGVSRAGLGVLVALLGGYFVLRFAVLGVGTPTLIERSSGYGFHTLDPPQLIERFGSNPAGFYVYNVVTSVLSVLFSEPRSGVFHLIHGISVNDPAPSMILNVIASTGATLIIGAFAWQRRHAWLVRRFDRDDRLVMLFAMVLAANAIISYPYTKDVIMSPAGVFFAVAVFVSARQVLPRWCTGGRLKGVLAVVCCGVLAATWAIRSVGIHLNLRLAALKVRTEWSYVEDWFERERIVIEAPRDRALFEYLKSDAIYGHPVPPSLAPIDNPIFDVD